MALKKLSKIDERTKNTVYGWIRNEEKELRIGHVPLVICAICILYYRDQGIFGIISNHGIKLSDNSKQITKIDKDRHQYYTNNNYGIMEIESESESVYKWYLKIIKMHDFDGINFGISSKSKPNDNYQDLDCICYGFNVNKFWSLKQEMSAWRSWKRYGDGLKDSNEVIVCLDLKQAQIKLIINGIDQKIAFDDIVKSKQINYKLYVSLHHINDCVEISDFSQE